jgi:hypothetical protein
MFSFRKMAILSGLSVATLIGPPVLGALPASAAGTGKILCGGDLCMQTLSVNDSTNNAVVAAWADTSNFYGHFEIICPYGQYENSPNENWKAGGANYKFTNVILEYGAYDIIAWKDSSGKYTNIGEIDTEING